MLGINLEKFGLPNYTLDVDGNLTTIKCGRVINIFNKQSIFLSYPNGIPKKGLKISPQSLFNMVFISPMQMFEPEEWVDGSVIGYSLYMCLNNGAIYSKNTNSYITPHIDRYGYAVSSFTNDNKVKKRVSVHRIIAMCFIPNPDNKPQVNHKDGDKLNNNVYNLEWMHPWENNRHARYNGLHKQTITDDVAIHIDKLLRSGMRICDVARTTGIDYYSISSIKYGRNHKHIQEYKNGPYVSNNVSA